MATGIRIGRGYIEIDADATKAQRALSAFARSSDKVLAGAAATAAASSLGIAAALGGVGLAFGALGVAAAAANEDVANSFKDLWGQVLVSAQRAAQPLEPVLIGIANQFGDLVADLEPSFREIATAFAPSLQVLGNSVESFARTVMPALVKSVQSSGPVFNAFGGLVEDVGKGLADFFTSISSQADPAARSIQSLGGIVRTALSFLGQLFAQLAPAGAQVLPQLESAFQQLTSTILQLSSTALPILAGAFGGALNLLSGFLSIVGLAGPQIGTMVGVVVSLVAAFKLLNAVTFGGVTDRFNALKTAVDGASGTANKFRVGIGGLVSAIGPLGLAAAGVGVLLATLGSRQQAAAEAAARHRASVQSLASALKESNGAINDGVRAAAAKALADTQVAGAGRNVLQVASALGISLPTLTDAYLGNAAAQAEVTRRLEELGRISQAEANAGQESADAAVNRRIAAGQLAETLADETGALGEAAESNRLEAEAQREAGAATRDHTKALAEQIDQALAAASADLALRQALLQVREAQDEAAEAAREHGRGSREAETANLALEQSMLRAITAAKEKALADTAGKSESDQLAASTRAVSGAIQQLATNATPQGVAALGSILHSMDATELAAIGARVSIDQAGQAVVSLPDGKVIPIQGEISDALRKAAEINRVLDDAARRREALIDVRLSRGLPGLSDLGNLGTRGVRANGGSIRQGGPYLVGENGPEVIFPSRAGFVATAQQTEELRRGAPRAQTGQSVAVTQNITPAQGASPEQIADIAVRRLNWSLGR